MAAAAALSDELSGFIPIDLWRHAEYLLQDDDSNTMLNMWNIWFHISNSTLSVLLIACQKASLWDTQQVGLQFQVGMEQGPGQSGRRPQSGHEWWSRRDGTGDQNDHPLPRPGRRRRDDDKFKDKLPPKGKDDRFCNSSKDGSDTCGGVSDP